MAHVVNLVEEVFNSGSEPVTIHNLNMVAVTVMVKKWTANPAVLTSVQVRKFKHRR